MKRRGLLVALALGLLPGSLRAAPSLEYAVKAAYLPKFIPFITWPDGAFAGADAPFTICLLGQDRLGANWIRPRLACGPAIMWCRCDIWRRPILRPIAS